MIGGEIFTLTSQGQFWWGFFGGAMVVIFRMANYARSLPESTLWPRWSFKNLVFCCVLVSLPVISGLVSIMCAPHYPFLAAFEGASAPAIFYFVAKHCPFIQS